MAPVSSLDCASVPSWNHSQETSDVVDALNGTIILITGAAGFIGVALVQRLLLDPKFSGINQVICIIRGDTIESATARLPESLQRLTVIKDDETEEKKVARLVVLNGDCGKPDLGLSGNELKTALKAQIVIHAAGDTRFTLPLSDAMGSIVSIILV